jgi:Protein kinase domain/Tetratricopeptide repeat
MSRVFIAREKALGRTVVLKVLPPELAAGISADRFRREIQVAANLQHPHIVPLLSAGQAGDFLYYTMPYIEGESLRERLASKGELPIPVAVRILGEVARALAHAHRHGVIHRDIKPDNILLTGDDAQVADFGIAKAIAASSEYAGLTSVGVALGTPLYMAPEQAAGDATTDARADLYALGVVAYEMLSGQPPFQGRTAAQLFAAHATERPVPLRERRPAVPVALADLIMRLLEKRPADRPQSVDELLLVLEVSNSASGTVEIRRVAQPTRERLGSRRGRWLLGGGVAAAVVLILALVALVNRNRPVKIDRAVVAVAPFRVSGADSSLGYLREGMVDLLAAKLGGTEGIRAANPRGLLAAWRRAAGASGDLSETDAIELAEQVGAGRLIQGDVVGTRQHITINAAVFQRGGGRTVVRASVEGSPDSLPRLVDRLAGQLLALEAGEGEQRLGNLTSTSLPALRAYLEGQALIRRGEFRKARERFEAALQVDSTFALAALGVSRAAVWFGQPTDGPGSVLAWKHRDKLPPVDRALLNVYLGGRWPAPPRLGDMVALAERFVQVAPDNPEAWYELGDELYHFGPLIGIADAHQRASQAFVRALALDSTFAPALEHGSSVALSLGDTVGARKALDRMLRVDSTSGRVASQQWEFAMAVGDSVGRAKALGNEKLVAPFVVSIGLSAGLPLQDVDFVLRRNRASAATAQEQSWVQRISHSNSIITGWPSRAVPLLEFEPQAERLSVLYFEWRYAGGDSAIGAAAGATLESAIGTPVSSVPGASAGRYAGGLHALERGRLDRAERALADLRNPRVAADSGWLREVPAAYALLLEAQLAGKRHSPELPKLLGRLDSTLVNPSFFPFATIGNLTVSRLYEEEGDLPRALAAIRRRMFDLYSSPMIVTYHREEGRLAAMNGDRKGAMSAYRRYLALRSGAEPRLQPQVVQVRGELDALERESTDR